LLAYPKADLAYYF